MNDKWKGYRLEISPFSKLVTCEWQRGKRVFQKKITQQTFINCLTAAIAQAEKKAVWSTKLLPQNCIAFSELTGGVVQATLLYDRGQADIAYGEHFYENFPLPNLLFTFTFTPGSRVNHIQMAAVEKGWLHPSLKIYRYPFSNVDSRGVLCTGVNEMPKCKKLYTLATLPGEILSMPNNNDHYRAQNNRMNLAFYDLLEYMKTKEPDTYYSEVLVPTGDDLSRYLESITQLNL